MSIICGSDLSDASGGALDVALALGKLRGDREGVLVHVADEDAGDEALSAARGKLDRLAKAHAGGLEIRTELVAGPTDETLARFADTEISDLIVISARSESTDEKRLGSTAHSISSFCSAVAFT